MRRQLGHGGAAVFQLRTNQRAELVELILGQADSGGCAVGPGVHLPSGFLEYRIDSADRLFELAGFVDDIERALADGGDADAGKGRAEEPGDLPAQALDAGGELGTEPVRGLRPGLFGLGPQAFEGIQVPDAAFQATLELLPEARGLAAAAVGGPADSLHRIVDAGQRAFLGVDGGLDPVG